MRSIKQFLEYQQSIPVTLDDKPCSYYKALHKLECAKDELDNFRSTQLAREGQRLLLIYGLSPQDSKVRDLRNALTDLIYNRSVMLDKILSSVSDAA